MSSPPPLELLESTHEFPCRFVFKAIGKNVDEFPERVVAAVRRALQHEFDLPCEIRQTAHGRHVAVTIEPQVASADDVLAIYDSLKRLEGLVMLL